MSYIIIFWDKSKLQVSKEVGDKLKEAIQSEAIKTFTLGQSLYSVSGVEKIVPKTEAYNLYPDQWELLKNLEEVRPSNELKQLTGEK